NGPTGVPALIFSNTVSNAPASLCALEFGLRGPNVTFNQREASSLAAIVYAAGAVRDRRVRAMISGGADRLEETFFKVHDRFRALSPMRGRGGIESSRPFDRCRNGYVLGEGGFLMLLESATSAGGRGERRRRRCVGDRGAAGRGARRDSANRGVCRSRPRVPRGGPPTGSSRFGADRSREQRRKRRDELQSRGADGIMTNTRPQLA